MDHKSLIRNIWVTMALLVIATAAAYAFFVASQNSTSVAILYVLAVMLVARSTDGYVPGIVASFIGVICVNYVFTYPYMKLNFSVDGYPVTFLGMMAVSGITSALTTRYKKQNLLLMEQEKLLMEAEKETMRANLLRAVSHDLRTPLTSIIGMADTYLENAANLPEEEKCRMVRGISEDANWLLNMVENLLSVTRIHVGDTRVNTVPEPVEEVVSEAVLRLRKRLPQIQIHVRVPEEFLMVPMDATLIEQVIINLCENAYYHCGVDTPIEFFVEKEDHEVTFHVRDYGRGIDPDRIATIFDGAGTDPNESGDSHKGMGIGLTICKTIVNAHHGQIYAQNHMQGVEFTFTLPMGEETKDSEQPKHSGD
jgi:two-component system sensor histidine kinase KdpD